LDEKTLDVEHSESHRTFALLVRTLNTNLSTLTYLAVRNRETPNDLSGVGV